MNEMLRTLMKWQTGNPKRKWAVVGEGDCVTVSVDSEVGTFNLHYVAGQFSKKHLVDAMDRCLMEYRRNGGKM